MPDPNDPNSVEIPQPVAPSTNPASNPAPAGFVPVSQGQAPQPQAPPPGFVPVAQRPVQGADIQRPQIDMQEANPGRGPIAAVKELGEGIAGLPGQVIHAFEDKPQNADEQEAYQKMYGGVDPENGDPRAAVAAHAALAYKRLVTDGIVESYNKARRLEQLAEKEKDPKKRKALMDAAGVYGGDATDQSSFRQRALSVLLHPGAGMGMVPLIGPMAGKMAETGEYGDLEKQAQVEADLKAGKITPQEAEQARAELAPDPSKALTSGAAMAMLPKAQEEMTHYVKLGGKWVLSKGMDAADATTKAAAATPAAPAPAPQASTGILRPGVKNIAGTDVPVRAAGPVAKVAESMLTNSAKTRLQDFEVNRTQSAVRGGVANVAKDVAGIDSVAAHATKEDPFGFGGTRDALQAKMKPDFEAVDKASDGAFSKAQKDAKLARGSLDYEGKKAYQAALDKQEQIFDSVKAMAGKGETPDIDASTIDQIKAGWKQSVGMDELASRFEKFVHPLPVDLMGEDGVDTGYVNPKQFREGITDARQSGEFEKAGFSPEHIQSLEKFGVELGKAQVKFNDTLSNLAKSLVGGGVGAGIGAALGSGVPGAVAGVVGENMVGRILSKIMTSEPAVKAMTAGLQSGASASGIAAMLKKLWADESGEAKIPGTGGAATGVAPAKVGATNVVRDNDAFQQAKRENPEGSISDWALRAHEIATQSQGLSAHGAGAASAEEIARGEKFLRVSPSGLKEFQGVSPDPSSALKPNEAIIAVKPDGTWRLQDGNPQIAEDHAARAIKAYQPKGPSALSSVAGSLDDAAAAAAAKKGEKNFVAEGADAYNKAQGRAPIQDIKSGADRRVNDIADAFDQMEHNPSNPKVKASYDALKKEIKAQWNHATKKLGINIEPTDTDPYGFSGDVPAEQQLFDDVEKNKHLGVWRGGNPLPADHPLAEIDPETGENYNTMLRAVHDIYGHVAGHNGFDEPGEEAAWQRHVQQVPDAAKPAMTTETRGQTSWFFHNEGVRGGEPLGKFADQKAGVLPDFAMNKSADYGKLADMHNEGGGFTFNPREGDMKGKAAFAVAGSYPELSRTVPSATLTPDQVQSYMETPEVAKVLASNPDASVGAWSHDGKTELEISETPNSLDAAKALAAKNNQISIWDLKKGEEIPTGGAGTLDTGRVGQRNPTAAKSEKGRNPLSNLGPDVLDRALSKNPKYAQSLADRFAGYGSLKFAPEGADEDFNPASLGEGSTNPKATIKDAIRQMTDNIVALHDMMPRHLRRLARQWYDSANEITKKQATEFGVSHPQAAGVTAVLSPQNPWDNNISLARRIMDIWKNKQDHAWSPEMNAKAAELYGQSPAIAKYTDMVRGKTFRQLTDPDPEVALAKKAMWVRLYDEAHNPSTFERWAPDGSTRGIARNESGSPAKSYWFSLPPIAKALSILDNGSLDNIQDQLGANHKVRNFYNNIIDPTSKMGDTTIDTHAVGVAHFSPFGLKDQEVVDNFKSPAYSAEGLKGTYPVYAEAYRQAAEKLGMLPRELQSITWEGIRSLFKEKSPELQGAVRDIWKEHQDGDITIEQARKRIVKAAGGFKPADWESDISRDEETGSAGNSTELPSAGVPQEKSQPDTGRGSGVAGTVPAARTSPALGQAVKEVGHVDDPAIAEMQRRIRGRAEEMAKKYPVGNALAMK